MPSRFFLFLLFLGLMDVSSANAGACTGAPSGGPGTWNSHACGSGTGHCAPSILPTYIPSTSASPLPAATAFSEIVNPMAACCGIGWGESIPAEKFDCVEAIPIPPAPPVFHSFLEFYNDGASADPIKTANVTYPNRMFVVGDDGVPLNGFYNALGKRCSYLDTTTNPRVTRTLTAAEQMKLLNEALNTGPVHNFPPSPLHPTSTGIAAEVPDSCCNAVVFALERTCPIKDFLPNAGGIQVAVSKTFAGVTTRRCTAAREMKLHFAVYDLCDPNVVKRTRFKTSTTFPSEDPRQVSIVQALPVQITNLIAQNYPVPSPLPAPSNCPLSPAVIEIPYSGGQCILIPPEPTPTP
jgi:hypothetical protein